MGYPLAPLLKVRNFREQAASAEVTAAAMRLTEAKEEVVRREEELVKYREWRVDEEKRLFEEIRKQEIPLHGVDDHNQRVLILRGREIQYEEAIQNAKAAVTKAEEDLAAAREAHRIATMEKRKIEEHREIWLEEDRREQARAEDVEMEEFSGGANSPFADDDEESGKL